MNLSEFKTNIALKYTLLLTLLLKWGQTNSMSHHTLCLAEKGQKGEMFGLALKRALSHLVA